MFLKCFAIVLLVSATILIASSCMHHADSGHSESIPEKISFNFDIRPILSDKCFKCHGPDANHRQAHLRLDIRDSAYAPLKETKGAYAIVPGKPAESELLKRITSSDITYMMPPPEAHLSMLTDREKKLFAKWIEQGAKYERHWAFTQPVKAALPAVQNAAWPKNEIDHFVLHKMEQQGLAPNEEADKERLLKRVCLDITGLPPSIEMMDRFLADNGRDAYEKIVDQLLSTPQYGEKMALHWLDVARYADSYGYQDDNIRTQWPWRDWVIHAFNSNMPYDLFLTWQIAGDMLPNANKEQILATGFFRNHKYTEEGGVVPEEYRIEYLIDKTKTYGKGILGVTIECAQCHDHKYDPFSQKDYYSLLAFFNNTKEAGFEGDVSVSTPAKMPILRIDSNDRKNILSFIHKKDTASLTVSVMGERDTVRKTYMLSRGRYDAPTKEVVPNALPAILNFDTTKFARNRLGLAQWTVNKNNPLTARVFVNQLWQEIFGRGIVKSSGDFGMQGDLPSNPELLDWLAADFMDHRWDIKRLVKQMVMSATYRQSARNTPEKQGRDPENIFLSHGPRNRLQAEFIRDLVLSSSGLLNKTIGGPSVKPYQPPGLWESATSGRGVLATYVQDHGDSLYRRGMYTFIKLTVPPPSMTMFDASNRDQCEVRRLKTNTPLQALIMLNDPTVLEASRVLAGKLTMEQNSAAEKIIKAFRLIVCRKPSDKELKTLEDYYDDQVHLFKEKASDAEKALDAGEYQQQKNTDESGAAALMQVITALYNLEETITKT
ncbi:MAG TPA: PSD1 and planctomycete cytochrome C domain-containing protein [Puia sp.]|nr:PSD1 and planctomycete cytochrome C domain-containing protein [Puia sp.]